MSVKSVIEKIIGTYSDRELKKSIPLLTRLRHLKTQWREKPMPSFAQ